MNKYEQLAEKVLREVEKEVGSILILTHKNPWTGRAFLTDEGRPAMKAPKPVSYISLDTYFHELGHLKLGHCDKNNKKTRFLEEYEADQFSQENFKRFGLPYRKKLRNRHNWHMARQLARAMNRGMKPKKIPPFMRKYRKYIDKCTVIDQDRNFVKYRYLAKILR